LLLVVLPLCTPDCRVLLAMANVGNIDALMVGQADIEALGLSEKIVAVRAMCTDSGRGLTKFATTLICFLEVTSQLEELDQASRQADHAVKHAMTFARTCLAEQQLRTIEVLEDLISHGASILKDPEGQSSEATSVSVSKMSVPPGLSGPPGLVSPLGLSSAMPNLEAPAAPSLSITRLLSMRSQVEMTQPTDRIQTLPAASLIAQGNAFIMRPVAQEFLPVVKSDSGLAMSPAAEEFVPSEHKIGTTLSRSAKEFVPEQPQKGSCPPLMNAVFFDDYESDVEDDNSTCSASSAFTPDAWDSE